MSDKSKYCDMGDHDLLVATAVNMDNVQQQLVKQNEVVATLQKKANALPCAVHDERIENLEATKKLTVTRYSQIKVGIIVASVTALIMWLSSTLSIP